MPENLKISISGIRGIVGSSLTPSRALDWTFAWEATLPEGPIVLARDARAHGEGLLHLLAGGLQYLGRRVLIAGLVPTPTVGVLVRAHQAAGGIMLTASHNPREWNALKLFNREGLILSPNEFTRLEPIWNAPPSLSAYPHKSGGLVESPADPLDAHLKLLLPHVDCERIRARRFRVVVDGCRSVGGIALPRALHEVGAEVIELDCIPDGAFTRALEPLTENLDSLCAKVRESRADLGMAVDPDADRLALVSEKGAPIGEEYTLVLAADSVLGRGGRGLVANLSSTLVLDSVARKHGSPIHRSKVGEAHVVDLIRETGAAIGGEGNGGVIFPPVQPGRDSLSGALLVLDLLAREGKSLSEMAADYPPAVMVKTKFPAEGGLWEMVEAKAGGLWPEATLDRTDGLKWIWSDRWIHLRASNTEPIIRILTEAPSEKEANRLVEGLRESLA
ncbi:MAG: phosphoglucosamine mutase [Candidatus Omnitrophica bacterium]|nr:phosphoglucosamine mutase [Candidatus Omnitrophota bacterium]